jgi:hypothetical protein
VGCVPLFQSLPQTPQSGKSFSALLNGGAPGEHSSGVESVPQSASHPDHVSFIALDYCTSRVILQVPFGVLFADVRFPQILEAISHIYI